MNSRLEALLAQPDDMRAVAQTGLDVLLAEPRADASRVAAVGYCFGGTLVLDFARSGADLKAVVGFHPGLRTSRPTEANAITGKILVCIGADDPFVPVEQRLAFEEEMQAGGVDWRMNVYGGVGHSFTHPWAKRQMPGIEYDEVADRRSWRAMLDLFDEVFG
jgi:dienelactone hydrolase